MSTAGRTFRGDRRSLVYLFFFRVVRFTGSYLIDFICGGRSEKLSFTNLVDVSFHYVLCLFLNVRCGESLFYDRGRDRVTYQVLFRGTIRVPTRKTLFTVHTEHCIFLTPLRAMLLATSTASLLLCSAASSSMTPSRTFKTLRNHLLRIPALKPHLSSPHNHLHLLYTRLRTISLFK